MVRFSLPDSPDGVGSSKWEWGASSPPWRQGARDPNLHFGGRCSVSVA